MELNEILTLARKLLTITRPLAAGPYRSKSLFARVVEGTFRRDYLTFYTMVYLAALDQPEAPKGLGTSCMDLCRRVLEDLISIEYMLLKGKEAFAKKFIEYRAIEAKRDMDYLEAAGVTMDVEYIKTTNENYNRVKRRFMESSSKTKRKVWNELTAFLKSQGKIDQQLEQLINEEGDKRYPDVKEPRKAWAGLETEAMIQELVEAGVFTSNEQKVLKQTYIMGNRKNHFSPMDISAFLSSAYYEAVDHDDLVLSLIATTTLMTRMSKIFADDFNLAVDTKQAIEEIEQTLLSANVPVKE